MNTVGRLLRRAAPATAPARPRHDWGLRRLALTGLTAGLGWLLAAGAGVQVRESSVGYLAIAGALLVVGLYSSTHGISRDELRVGAGTVLLAVTVGVLAKAALIAGAMYLVFREPRYAVLGLAVAQIDPLAVAAMSTGSRMSARARALLAAWASFDDPITVVLTVYGAAWVLQQDPTGTGRLRTVGPAAGSIGAGIAQNLALAALALLLWLVLQRFRAARDAARAGGWRDGGGPGWPAVAETVVLVVLLALAVVYSLALGVALLGLFFRPPLGRLLGGVTQGAFLAACFLLGLALAQGVDPWAGLVLGVAAFGAQVVVGLVIPARISRRDRAYLAVGQQNGITAVILALLLEASVPGTVGVVAPAILVVAVLHAATNGILDTGRSLTSGGRRRTSAGAPTRPGAAERHGVLPSQPAADTSAVPEAERERG